MHICEFCISDSTHRRSKIFRKIVIASLQSMWSRLLVIMITTDVYIVLHVTCDVEVTKCVQGIINTGYLHVRHHFTRRT